MNSSNGQQAPVATPINKPNPVLKWIRAHLVERTLRRLPKSSDILDLCCGYGFYFTMNPAARGIDGDPVCIGQLKSQGFNVTVGDVLKPLPYEDASFSAVIAHDALEHFTFDQLVRLMSNVHKVLKPSALFYVFVPNRKGFDYGIRIGNGHQLYVTAKEMVELAKGKFEIVKHYPEPLPRVIGKYFTHNKEVFVLKKL